MKTSPANKGPFGDPGGPKLSLKSGLPTIRAKFPSHLHQPSPSRGSHPDPVNQTTEQSTKCVYLSQRGRWQWAQIQSADSRVGRVGRVGKRTERNLWIRKLRNQFWGTGLGFPYDPIAQFGCALLLLFARFPARQPSRASLGWDWDTCARFKSRNLPPEQPSGHQKPASEPFPEHHPTLSDSNFPLGSAAVGAALSSVLVLSILRGVEHP